MVTHSHSSPGRDRMGPKYRYSIGAGVCGPREPTATHHLAATGWGTNTGKVGAGVCGPRELTATHHLAATGWGTNTGTV